MDEESPDLKTIEGRLRHARVLAQYDGPAEAARAFGWVYSTYAGHENGSRGIKLGTLRGYAAAFGVSFSWLAEGKGEARPTGAKKVSERWQEMSPEDRALYEAMGDQLVERNRRRK
jgi:transcriptional regulator with XRE-family HTH domain